MTSMIMTCSTTLLMGVLLSLIGANMSAFTTVLVSAERTTGENNVREAKAQREARAKALFTTGGFSYEGRLPLAAREQLAKGQPVSVTNLGITDASIDNPKQLACAICGGVHDLRDVKLSAKITFLRKGTSTVALSDTCRKDYFGIHASKALDTASMVKYRNDFPKGKTR